MSVRLKIILGFTVIILLTVTVGLIGINSTDKVSGTGQQMYSENIVPLKDVTAFFDLLQVQRVNLLNMYVYQEVNPDFYASEAQSLAEKEAGFEEALKSYEGAISNEEDQKVYDDIKALYFGDFTAKKQGVKDALASGNDKSITDSLLALDATSSDITGLFDEAQRINDELAKAAVTEGVGLATNSRYLLLLIISAAFVVSAGLAVYLTRWIMNKIRYYENILDCIPFPISVTDSKRNWTFINKPVEDMLKLRRSDVLGKACSTWSAGICNTSNCGIECLGRGQNSTTFEQANMDFKVDISYLTNAKGKKVGHVEVVQDISAMMQTQKSEEKLVHDIEVISNSFVSGSRQISDGTQSLAQGATEQAASTEQLAASVSELRDQANSNADTAKKTQDLASSIKASAEQGSKQMDEMLGAVNEINQASQSISKVIKVIDDIAFQTNILALNAAVEAARAGQHGKGFAVVSEEVRNLAAKSAEAAKDTGSLIQNSIAKAELGAQIAKDTATSLGEIVAGINESDKMISNIAQSSESQLVGLSQVNDAVQQMAQVVQELSATTEENAASAELLNNQAVKLGSMIEDFRKEV
jgi:methyl-accepting chemotaxis protein